MKALLLLAVLVLSTPTYAALTRIGVMLPEECLFFSAATECQIFTH